MKNLNQKHTILSEREIVFAAMTNPVIIEIWSGYKAELELIEGSEFSLWEGDIVGKNLKIIPGKLLQQEWYFDGQVEKSIVTLKLSDKEKGTLVELKHQNIPDEAYDDIREGWKKYYFGSLKKYFK